VNGADIRSLRERLRLPLSLLGAVVVIGTLGYWALWRTRDASVLEALYMTIITITTVGYREVHPLDELGLVLTMAVAVDPSAATARLAQERDYLHVAADATEDAVLERAGIRRARGLIVTTGNDDEHVHRPVGARAEPRPLRRLPRRGRDEHRQAAACGCEPGHQPVRDRRPPARAPAAQPDRRGFLRDRAAPRPRGAHIESIAVGPECATVGCTLGSLDIRRATGATVLAVMRDGTPIANPGGEFVLAGGDQVLALGTTPQLDALERLLRPD
jgi:voltage-gated potassium channel